MSTAKKITIHVPEDLLTRAQDSSGVGITETIRRGLVLVAAGGAYKKLRALRGKVKLGLDIKKLRDDRR